jgi:hypothetical protein
MNRRHFLTGLGTLLAAPAIVKVASIMPVRVLPPPDFYGVSYIEALVRSIQIMKERMAATVFNAPTTLICRPIDVEAYRAILTPQGRNAAAPSANG